MNDYESLNEPQREGVFTTEGPVLLLAGAGSGKTRVITYRIAHLIKDENVQPWNILAITFTNKAAGEMKERIEGILGQDSLGIWVSTFHSLCVRILRKFAPRLGYDENFTIYDADDQKTLMRNLIKRNELDPKMFREKGVLGEISHAKDELISSVDYARNAAGDPYKTVVGRLYREYQGELQKNNAFDFDDLIVKTVNLLSTDPEVKAYYNDRFHYIMVDEYQDTNTAQFELVRLLTGERKNLCVVGDDDQSIYKFRGANIYNILNFEKFFPEAKVIKLEENYRSTGNILAAANAVIKNNRGRKEKALWTQKEAGDSIILKVVDSAPEEAEYIVNEVRKAYKRGEPFGSQAILYRTNAQSRLLEERFVAAGIPYKIVGGVNFYSRKEIKDVLAYLKTIDNGQDDLSVMRIINVPKRGIGATSLGKVADYAQRGDISLYEGLCDAERIGSLGAAAKKINGFVNFISVARARAKTMSIAQLIRWIVEETGYLEELKKEDKEEDTDRVENVEEFINKAADYDENAEDPTLSGFLQEVMLVADIDSLEDDKDYVVLMTLHGAKGLEFPRVFLAGMEDGLFPSFMSITSDNSQEELEEERRLCYVGITRAMNNLVITSARSRLVRGELQYSRLSRFVEEIPNELFGGDNPGNTGGRRRTEGRSASEVLGGRGFGSGQNSYGGDGSYGGASSGRSLSSIAGKVTKRPVSSITMKASSPAKNIGSAGGNGGLGYEIGDRVRHMKFGQGTVKNIVSGGRDYEVTVDFDTAGIKKMFAGFAKLEKI